MTTERIAIAELERELVALRAHDKATRGAAIAAAIADAVRREPSADGGLRDLRVAALQAQHALVDQDMLIVDLNKQLNELTEKCAALVVENKRLAEHAGKWVNVETPAVEEQGPWVVYDEGCTESDLKWRTAEGWFFRLVQPKCFSSREDAQEAIRDFGARAKSFRVITLAEARAIEAKR